MHKRSAVIIKESLLCASQLPTSAPQRKPRLPRFLVSTIRNKDACKLTPKIVLWTVQHLAFFFFFSLYLVSWSSCPISSCFISCNSCIHCVLKSGFLQGRNFISTSNAVFSQYYSTPPLHPPLLWRTERAGLCLKHSITWKDGQTWSRLSMAPLYWKNSGNLQFKKNIKNQVQELWLPYPASLTSSFTNVICKWRSP